MHPDPRSVPAPPLPPAPRPGATNTTWWWFLVPLMTCGFGTWAIVWYGGLKLRSRPHQIAAALYAAATLAFFTVSAASTTVDGTNADGSPHYNVESDASIPFALMPWFLGFAHVLWLQVKVQALAPAAAPASWSPPGTDPAIVAAQSRAYRRQEARQLLAAQPALASELRIGRPDVPDRQYDDGGLVDVNHVSAQWLTYMLEMTPQQAAEIVAQRDAHRGFTSADELMVYCNSMTAERIAVIRDRLAFVPL